MSFKSVDEIIKHYQKEIKPMNNVNYNPEKLAEFKEMDRQQRFNNRHQRMLVDMRIRQVDPSYRVSEDEPVCCSCHIVAPCSWCVKNLSEPE